MSLRLLRQQAIELRIQGKTYGQIKEALNIPKSTLSNWLHEYPLSTTQFKKLEENRKLIKYLSIEKTIITKRKKREKRLSKVYKEEQKRLIPLSIDQLEIAGLFLYWGEGNKYMKGSVSISNTDPKIIKFILYWLTVFFRVPQEKIKINLHLYSDMEIEESQKFWSEKLDIPLSQFTKPYIKTSLRASIDQRGFGYGTCTIVVNDIRLKEKIMMGIKSIADHYSENISPML